MSCLPFQQELGGAMHAPAPSARSLCAWCLLIHAKQHAARMRTGVPALTTAAPLPSMVLTGTEYRRFSPGSQPVKAIIPHDVPQLVYDIKYFGASPRPALHTTLLCARARAHAC